MMLTSKQIWKIETPARRAAERVQERKYQERQKLILDVALYGMVFLLWLIFGR